MDSWGQHSEWREGDKIIRRRKRKLHRRKENYVEEPDQWDVGSGGGGGFYTYTINANNVDTSNRDIYSRINSAAQFNFTDSRFGILGRADYLTYYYYTDATRTEEESLSNYNWLIGPSWRAPWLEPWFGLNLSMGVSGQDFLVIRDFSGETVKPNSVDVTTIYMGGSGYIPLGGYGRLVGEGAIYWLPQVSEFEVEDYFMLDAGGGYRHQPFKSWPVRISYMYYHLRKVFTLREDEVEGGTTLSTFNNELMIRASYFW